MEASPSSRSSCSPTDSTPQRMDQGDSSPATPQATNGQSRTYDCSICRKRVGTTHAFARHMRRHRLNRQQLSVDRRTYQANSSNAGEIRNSFNPPATLSLPSTNLLPFLWREIHGGTARRWHVVPPNGNTFMGRHGGSWPSTSELMPAHGAMQKPPQVVANSSQLNPLLGGLIPISNSGIVHGSNHDDGSGLANFSLGSRMPSVPANNPMPSGATLRGAMTIPWFAGAGSNAGGRTEDRDRANSDSMGSNILPFNPEDGTRNFLQAIERGIRDNSYGIGSNIAPADAGEGSSGRNTVELINFMGVSPDEAYEADVSN